MPPGRLELVCAEIDGQARLPLMAIDPPTRRAWMLDRGTRALAERSMPPMRPLSVGLALVLAAGSLAWAPLAAAAVAYGGYRALRRAFRRRMLHAEIEIGLRGWLAELPAAAPPPTDYRSVRSFQISGNSTTSSILRR